MSLLGASNVCRILYRVWLGMTMAFLDGWLASTWTFWDDYIGLGSVVNRFYLCPNCIVLPWAISSMIWRVESIETAWKRRFICRLMSVVEVRYKPEAARVSSNVRAIFYFSLRIPFGCGCSSFSIFYYASIHGFSGWVETMMNQPGVLYQYCWQLARLSA